MTDIRDLYNIPYYSREQLEFIFSQIFSKKLSNEELNKPPEFERLPEKTQQNLTLDKMSVGNE